MNWQQVTQSFLPLSREQTSSFAPPREVDLAIAAYNRAIRNLNQDSADIALIALRRLASDYPDFLEASLLYGCCLAQVGQLTDAREQLVKTASHPELPGDLEEATHAALQAVDQDIAAQPALPANSKSAHEFGSADLPVRPADAVLEKTGRKARVRMASEREKRDVMRRSDMPQDEETHVIMDRSPMDFLRIAVPVAAALILIVLVIFVAIRVLPTLHIGGKSDTEKRLDYLLAEIEKQAEGDDAIKKLLADYQAHFNPTPTPAFTTTAGAVMTTAAPTTTATTTAATTLSTTAPAETTAATTAATTPPALAQAALTLQSAATLVQQAIAVKATDNVTASEKLYQAIEQLKTIPADTTAAGVSKNAGDLLNEARAEYEPIYKLAAEKLRKIAVPLFDSGKYQESLSYYLRAFTLYPGCYGGGVAYYCGRNYQMLKKYDLARPYYEYVVANFAGRDIATSAAYRLKEIG